MLDLFFMLRGAISSTCETVTGRRILPQDIDCAARGYGARSAFALRLGLDATRVAAELNRNSGAFLFEGIPLISQVGEYGGHILFTFTDGFYSAALSLLLRSFPVVGALPLLEAGDARIFMRTAPRAATTHAYAARARISYVQRRAWMLGRRREGEETCPALAPVQHALLLAAGLMDVAPCNRAKRALDCCDALLEMTRCVPPFERREHLRACAHVAAAAASILYCYVQQTGGYIDEY